MCKPHFILFLLVFGREPLKISCLTISDAQYMEIQNALATLLFLLLFNTSPLRLKIRYCWDLFLLAYKGRDLYPFIIIVFQVPRILPYT